MTAELANMSMFVHEGVYYSVQDGVYAGVYVCACDCVRKCVMHVLILLPDLGFHVTQELR